VVIDGERSRRRRPGRRPKTAEFACFFSCSFIEGEGRVRLFDTRGLKLELREIYNIGLFATLAMGCFTFANLGC
jgi:hypothetical protein